MCLSEQVPTSQALSILQDIDGDGSMDLFNVVGQVAIADRYSDWWDHDTELSSANHVDDGTAEHSELDHMLLTPGLRDRVTRVWIDHGHNPADVSDHWPLMAQLQRQPASVEWGALVGRSKGGGDGGDGGDGAGTGAGDGAGSSWVVALTIMLAVVVVAALRSKQLRNSKAIVQSSGIYDGQAESEVP